MAQNKPNGVRIGRHRRLLLLLGAALALVPAACSSKSTATSSGHDLSLPPIGVTTTTPAFGTSTAARRTVPGTVRVVNLNNPNGKPLNFDLYDDALPQDRPQPIVKNVGYGTVTQPFKLHVNKSDSSNDALIYGVAAGTKPSTFKDFHDLVPSGGFASNADVLVVLANGDSSNDASFMGDLSESEVYFTDPKNEHGGPTVSKPPSGMANLDVLDNAYTYQKNADGKPVYVNTFVDGICTSSNSQSDAPPTTIESVQDVHGTSHLVVKPGKHEVAFFIDESGGALCSQMSPLVGKTTVTTTAGKTLYAIPYGPANDPKVLTVDGP